jgi:predicted DNA-binding transcriptional regulator AlpA
MTAPNHPLSAPPAGTPLLIDLRELSRLLDRSRASIARDVTAGRLPTPVRIGRSTRWRLSEIELWIAAGCPPRDRLTANGELGPGDGASVLAG